MLLGFCRSIRLELWQTIKLQIMKHMLHCFVHACLLNVPEVGLAGVQISIHNSAVCDQLLVLVELNRDQYPSAELKRASGN